MNAIILVLAQIAAFQAHDKGVERTPKHLATALEHVVCAEPYEDGFYDVLRKYEKKHRMQFDDEVWEITDRCDD